MDNKMNKRGQITIFVILAILIVAVILLLFTVYDNPIRRYIQKQTSEPNQNIENCVEKIIDDASEKIIENAGYINSPPLTKMFGYHIGESDEIPLKNYTYLCYTPGYRLRCIPSDAITIDHLRKEIKEYASPKIDSCFKSLKSNLEEQGYSVTLDNQMNFSVEFISRTIKIEIERKLEFSKAEQYKKFEEYNVRVGSPIYDIIIIVHEIILQEVKYCNSDNIDIMKQYKNFEINKFQTGDGSKIYTIKDLLSEKIFRFVIRGCVLPAPN